LLSGVRKKEDPMTIPDDLLNDLRNSSTDLARMLKPWFVTDFRT
jgi:hypothetical protein